LKRGFHIRAFELLGKNCIELIEPRASGFVPTG